MITLAAGFGCQRGCSVEVLSALLDQVLLTNGLHHEQLIGIASLDRKADEPGLVALAALLKVPFRTFGAVDLAVYEDRLSARSEVSFAHTGCYGVAESSALALAGSSAELRVTRQSLCGATLALAIAPQCPDNG